MGFGKDSAQRLSLGEEPSGNALGLKSQANFCLEGQYYKDSAQRLSLGEEPSGILDAGEDALG